MVFPAKHYSLLNYLIAWHYFFQNFREKIVFEIWLANEYAFFWFLCYKKCGWKRHFSSAYSLQNKIKHSAWLKKSLGSEVIYFVDIRIKTGYMKQIYEVRPKNSFLKFSLWLVFSLYFVFVTFQVVKECDFVKNELNHPLFGDQDKLLAVVQIFLFWRLFLNIPSLLSNQALCFISISNRQENSGTKITVCR